MDSALYDTTSPPAAPLGTETVPGPGRAALSAIRLLFDRVWYLEHNPDVAASGIEPLDHFLTCGLSEGRAPCALFDPEFYLRQPGAPRGTSFLFLHYLDIGVPARIDPHPLIESRFYAEQDPPLPPGTNPLIHMLGAGRRSFRRPNPLFDPAYYRRHSGIDAATLPLLHYITRGWQAGMAPHPLFDPAIYLSARPDVGTVGLDPLAHYLHCGHLEGASPTWLFDAAHMADDPDAPAEPSRALLAYAAHGSRHRAPVLFFDPDHYRRNNPDLIHSGLDPFLHFVEFGLAEDRDPHPLFDTRFYRDRYADVAESGMPPFLHFIRHGAAEGRHPNRFFPASAYLDRHPEARDWPGGAMAHFLAHPSCHLEQFCPEFDSVYYRDCHHDCAAAAHDGMPPLGHYLSIGRAAGYSPRPEPLEAHGWSAAPSAAAAPGSDAATLLLLVQEATHGDSTLAALRCLETLVGDPALSCRVVIREDGPMRATFAALAPTLALPRDEAAASDALTGLLYSLSQQRGAIVLVDGIAQHAAACLAGRLGIRSLLWLRETPVAMDSLHGGAAMIQRLLESRARLVVPTAAAAEALAQHYAIGPGLIIHVADGMPTLPPGLDSRVASLELREALGLPPDCLVVLGHGGIDFASGTDLFVRLAGLVIGRAELEAPQDSALRQACFLWIGEAADPLFAALCRHDIERLGLSDRVRIIAPPEDTIAMLLGADLFLLANRDGSCCPAALSARRHGLALLGFEGCGLALGPTGSGSVTETPYLDLEAMASAVLRLGDRPARRTRASLPPGPAGPSWSDWHRTMRPLLLDATNGSGGE